MRFVTREVSTRYIGLRAFDEAIFRKVSGPPWAFGESVRFLRVQRGKSILGVGRTKFDWRHLVGLAVGL
jgi:hypothetical protein